MANGFVKTGITSTLDGEWDKSEEEESQEESDREDDFDKESEVGEESEVYKVN